MAWADIGKLYVLSGQAHATLIFMIGTYTTDEFSLNLHETFDTNSVGASSDYLAIKNVTSWEQSECPQYHLKRR